MAEGTERLFAEERQNRILALLNENGKVLIPELCTHFSVSSVTVRNDLNELERQGRLRRTHGGAIPVSKTALEPDFRHHHARLGAKTDRKAPPHRGDERS